MVGSDYQAQIPEGLCHYDDALPYENEDKLLWDPYDMDSVMVEDYLKKAAAVTKPLIPMGTQLRDDEQALYLLQQCGHNMDEALRRLGMNVIPNADNMSLWSEEECRNFESGVRTYGKNFHLIQQNKVNNSDDDNNKNNDPNYKNESNDNTDINDKNKNNDNHDENRSNGNNEKKDIDENDIIRNLMSW